MKTAPLSQPQSQVFCRQKIAQNRKRSKHYHLEHGFLIDWAANQLLDRLDDIKRNFGTVLHIGQRCSEDFQSQLRAKTQARTVVEMDLFQEQHSVVGDEEYLPFAPQSLDLILNLFTLHTINDLPGALIQMKQALKSDGLCLGAMLGGETLHELRQSLMQTELELTGGVSPRVAPFADKQDMGALLQRAGFALPVVDSDIVKVSYDNAFKLMHDLRYMGEGNTIEARNKSYTGREFFLKAAQHYAENFSDTDGKITATFEIIFVIGWAPHASQQKPLKPGSAQNRLADALNTKERNL